MILYTIYLIVKMITQMLLIRCLCELTEEGAGDMMLRGRSRAVAKQTLAADHRSHSQPTPTQNRQQQNPPPPLSRFLLKFRQFSVGTHVTPFSENRGTPSSDRGQRRSWELESESRGISLIVAAGRSKRVLFGTEIKVRTVNPGPARAPNTPPEADAKTRRRDSKTGESFLSSCYTCKKMIEPTADIYIYRGEKAFCSGDCRQREILQDSAGNLQEDED